MYHTLVFLQYKILLAVSRNRKQGRGERASVRLATKSRNNPNELGIKNKQTVLKETIHKKSNFRRSGQR